MIKNYIKIAWRNATKHPVFSIINIGGLALGIASSLLLIFYIIYQLGFDKQFRNIDNIYIVENNQPGDGKVYTFDTTPAPMAATIKSELPGVERTVRTLTYSAGGLIAYKNNSFKKDGLFADNGFFSMFSYHFIEGNADNALAKPNSIVITKRLSEILFGSTDPMNKLVLRNNKTSLMVTGVIDNLPPNTTFQFDYVLPWSTIESENDFVKTAGWGSTFCQTLVQLKNTSGFNTANLGIRKMINSHHSEDKGETMLFPFSKTHLYSKFENGKSVGGLIDQIYLFVILALCILLIACFNFMNLSTARAGERVKEVGIRKVIGSDRWSLIWQFTVESLILTFVAMAVALILVTVTIPFFNQLLNVDLTQSIYQWHVLLMLAGLTAFTGIVSGSYPAFFLSSFKPIHVLKGVFRASGKSLSMRKVLVVLQFAVAVFLITATICIYRQIRFIQNRPAGFDKDNLIEVDVEGALSKKADVLVNELKKANVISNATSLSQSIAQNPNNSTWGIGWPGKQPDQKVLFNILKFGDDFVHTAGVKLMQGREFSTQYPSDTAGKTVMINETAAKLMNLKQPVGAIINWGEPVTIIGVYKDFVFGSAYKKAMPMVSTCSTNANVIAMRLNAHQDLHQSINYIESVLKNINPAYPPVIKFVDDNFAKKIESEKLLATLANLFGGLAIVISCLGLFGLAAYAAQQRVKEIGVRKVPARQT
jgi:putative ABC transport system permease protein